MKNSAKNVCMVVIGIMLFAVAASVRILVSGNYGFCMGYAVMAAFFSYMGTVPGITVCMVGTFLYCMLSQNPAVATWGTLGMMSESAAVCIAFAYMMRRGWLWSARNPR